MANIFYTTITSMTLNMDHSKAELRCPLVMGTGFLLKHMRRSSRNAQDDDDLDMLTELDMRLSSAKSSGLNSASPVNIGQSLPAADTEHVQKQSMFSTPVAPTTSKTFRPGGRRYA